MDYLSTRIILDKYKFKFTKSLGQNFLIDDTVINDIIKGAEITKDDFIIEIGPGIGTLTRQLLDKAKHVYSIEIDKKLIPILNEELKDYENFTLIHDDALKMDLSKITNGKQNVKVVANLPYYLTTPLITKLISNQNNIKSLTIMIQKEVAERINAHPSSKEYGALTLLVQYYCKTKVIRKVSPGCFVPRPSVESSVIRLDKLENPRVDVKDEKLFFRVIKSSFNMRRKTLWNSLKILGIPKDKIKIAFENANIDPKRRGETLTIDEFANLSDQIHLIK